MMLVHLVPVPTSITDKQICCLHSNYSFDVVENLHGNSTTAGLNDFAATVYTRTTEHLRGSSSLNYGDSFAEDGCGCNSHFLSVLL